MVSPCAGERQKTQAKKQAETACVSSGEERENPFASGITHECATTGPADEETKEQKLPKHKDKGVTKQFSV